MNKAERVVLIVILVFLALIDYVTDREIKELRKLIKQEKGIVHVETKLEGKTKWINGKDV